MLVVMPLNSGSAEEVEEEEEERAEEAEEGRELDRRWLKRDTSRGPIRGEARMAEMPTKRSTAKKPSRRDRARIASGCSYRRELEEHACPWGKVQLPIARYNVRW